MDKSQQTIALTSTPEEMLEYLDGKKNEMIKLGMHREAPCLICGHNGPNFYQPEHHECMKIEEEVYGD